MVNKTLVYDLKIFNALFIATIAIFLAVFADLSYGQPGAPVLGRVENGTGCFSSSLK